jgi:hypothetical protein
LTSADLGGDDLGPKGSDMLQRVAFIGLGSIGFPFTGTPVIGRSQ